MVPGCNRASSRFVFFRSPWLPAGIKTPDAERHGLFYGRQGRLVIKPRFTPAQLAYQLARKLQALGLTASPGCPGAAEPGDVEGCHAISQTSRGYCGLGGSGAAAIQ